MDSHSPRVTLGNGGQTIAVLGGGIDGVYPSENNSLADEIDYGEGAVISEFPIGMNSVPGNFPAWVEKGRYGGQTIPAQKTT